ncbi:MAG: sigma-70 family RNA polymerase sigma factor [Planctomycetia bacterium]|jgi:RNA polymerase sigma-70 factor (ECF subfamily)
MSDPSRDQSDAADQRAVQLITEVQLGLYRYLSALVFSVEEIEEIRQETNMALWRKRDQFEEIENFNAWARRVAYLEVLAWRRRQNRGPHLLDDDVLELIAEAGTQQASLSDERSAALMHCVGRLSEKDRAMLAMRYQEEMTSAAIGEKLSRSSAGIRQSLLRIHRALRECVQKRLATS